MTDVRSRLDRIRDRITSDEFLKGKGLGNEVPFYAFDYPPAAELQVNSHIAWLLADVARRNSPRIANINVFGLAIRLLKERGLYEKSLSMEQVKGIQALLAALKGPLDPSKLAQALIAEVETERTDILFLTGVGAAYPLVRTHSLLNNLQPHIGRMPLVLFFPGRFNGQSLQLFAELQETPYYRAFRLVD